MVRRVRICSRLSLGALLPWLAGCSVFLGIQDTLAERRCSGEGHHDALVRLVRESPLLAAPTRTTVNSDNPALRRALRFNGLPVAWDGGSTNVRLSCSKVRLAEGRQADTVFTLEAPDEWMITSVAPSAENAPQPPVVAVNLAGDTPLPRATRNLVAVVGNNTPAPVYPSQFAPLTPDALPDQPTAPDPVAEGAEPGLPEDDVLVQKESDADAPPVSAPELADVQPETVGSAAPPAAPPVVVAGSPESTPSAPAEAPPASPAEATDQPDVPAYCAVLRPPNLREAVMVALRCAGAPWVLVPPSRTEPRDYRLPHAIRLEGGPDEWMALLTKKYGLRFDHQ